MSADEKYIKRGVFLALPQAFHSWNAELAVMNEGKRGGQFEYPNSFIEFVATVKDYTGMASRVMEGLLLGLSSYVPRVKRCDHTTICRRVNKFSKKLKDKGGSVIAVDSSGLAPARRGAWLTTKHRKKKPYVKVHLAVDVRDGKILEFKVTPDSVHDNKAFPELVEKAGEKARLKKVLADGAYDDAKNDKSMEEQDVELVVPPRKNSRVKRKPPPETAARNKRVQEYKRLGKKKWKKRKGYGARWAVETVYSTWKRLLGEGLSARTPEGVLAEVNRKVLFLNKLLAL